MALGFARYSGKISYSTLAAGVSALLGLLQAFTSLFSTGIDIVMG